MMMLTMALCAVLLGCVAAERYDELAGVDDWEPARVAEWMKSLGCCSDYAPAIIKEKVDGHALLIVEDDDLKTLGVESAIHRKTIRAGIEELRKKIAHQPNDVWEYYAAHRRTTPLYISALQTTPRGFVLYLWYYHYDDMLSKLFSQDGTSPKFWAATIFIPHLQAAYYVATNFITTHKILGTALCANLAIQGFIEAVLFLVTIATNQNGTVAGMFGWVVHIVQNNVKQAVLTVVMYYIWLVVPWFLSDFYFYLSVYLLPFAVMIQSLMVLLGTLGMGMAVGHSLNVAEQKKLQ